MCGANCFGENAVGGDIFGENQLVETFLGRISWWRHFWGESVGGDIFGEN